jgi:hypothetical protein
MPQYILLFSSLNESFDFLMELLLLLLLLVVVVVVVVRVYKLPCFVLCL